MKLLSSNDEYVLEPCTINNKGAYIQNVGFSISKNRGDTFVNIYIPSVGLEFTEDGYDLERLIADTISVRIKDYLGPRIISDYSLQEGTGLKDVLTLKIGRDNHNKFSLFMATENIPILKNSNYGDSISLDFTHYVSEFLRREKEYDNSQLLVSNLMVLYSLTLSRYLYRKNIAYAVKKGIGDFGIFTSTLSKREALINQYIMLQHIKDIKSRPFHKLLLSEEQSLDFDKKDRSKVFASKSLTHNRY